MIPYAKHLISPADISAVVELLECGSITQGETVPLFENQVSDIVGSKYAVAVNSATSGLHLACIALGLGKGDLLWTTPNSFVASANCGLYCGAEVDFVDIDPKTYNMCPELLANKLSRASNIGKLPKIVIPVHFAGQSSDVESIFRLSLKYGFRIIEDASHAIGGARAGVPIGSSAYSDATVFSFHPAKIITTGEGGIVTTNSESVNSSIRRLRTHGIDRSTTHIADQSNGEWYYEQVELGFNYRLTDLQAALGKSQLTSLAKFIFKRQQLVDRYNRELSELPITLPYLDPNNRSSNHLYVIKVNPDAPVNRLQVFNKLRDLGIMVNVHYIPIPAHPFYRNLGFNMHDFPNAMAYYQHAITLPLFPSLLESDQDFIIRSLKTIFQ